MPSIEQNISAWNRDYPWADDGEEWSTQWGGSAAQWFGTWYPRLRRSLPAQVILEIAPGYGRWTQYLAEQCERLIGVDLSPVCVEVCSRRFADHPHLEFHTNDGRSLDDVADRTIDLAVSLDSLVHCEADVLAAYLAELERTLNDDGVAVLHHSNAGAYPEQFVGWDELTPEEIAALEEAGSRPRSHWRAMSMDATVMRQLVADAGLVCRGQELVNWGGDLLIDCISTIVRPESTSARDCVTLENHDFAGEMRSVCVTASVYAAS